MTMEPPRLKSYQPTRKENVGAKHLPIKCEPRSPATTQMLRPVFRECMGEAIATRVDHLGVKRLAIAWLLQPLEDVGENLRIVAKPACTT